MPLQPLTQKFFTILTRKLKLEKLSPKVFSCLALKMGYQIFYLIALKSSNHKLLKADWLNYLLHLLIELALS
jgi:hypothetical protein